MTIPANVIKNAPTLFFSKSEKYLPCDLFFSGKEVINNKQEYDALTSTEKNDVASCYYHITNGKKYTILQYWYYYSFNNYRLDDHEHDFECVKIFINKTTQQPMYINCNVHSYNKVVDLKNKMVPKVKVDLGSHAMLPDIDDLTLPLHSWIWHGTKDKEYKILPKKSIEELRIEVMKNPHQVIDKDFKIIGNDYDLIGIGRFYAPKMPWARIEYYIPERSLPKMEIKKSLVGLEPEEETPSLEFFLGSQKYAFILNKAGINSPKDLVSRNLDLIQSKMKKISKEENLKIIIPSKKEISHWKDLIVKK